MRMGGGGRERVEGSARQPQVLVVGAGPAGLVAALVLGRQGVDVLLVDKRQRLSQLSRALSVSTRTMELLRSWGLEEAVRSRAVEVEPLALRTRTLASGEGTEIPLGAPTAAQAALVSPTRPAWVPQAEVEPLPLDLLGDGLTLFTGPRHQEWQDCLAATTVRAPVVLRAVLDHAAGRLGIPGGGALLVRPDGRRVATRGAPPHGVELQSLAPA